MARKILLADDSVTAQNMGRKILADAGYEVITVNNGSAALKKITEIHPDLIVLDVYMPGYSGLEVCQRLKEGNETARIPVLLTVGKLEPFKQDEARRARADAFIIKPFEATELLSAVGKLQDKLGVVPTPSPAKDTKFATATMTNFEKAMEQGGPKFGDQDSGWKARLTIPTGGAKPEESEPEQTPAPAAATFRDAVEVKADDREPKASPRAIDRPIPAGIPQDITAEEIAAITAAAARVNVGANVGKDFERFKSDSSALETTPIEQPVDKKKRTKEAEKAAIVEETKTTPIMPPASKSAEPEVIPAVASEAVPAIGSTKAPEPALVAAAAKIQEPVVSVAEPATMAVGPRWVAEEVALAADESMVVLEREMHKAFAAFAAAEYAALPADQRGEVDKNDEPLFASMAPPAIGSPVPVEADSSHENEAEEEAASSGQTEVSSTPLVSKPPASPFAPAAAMKVDEEDHAVAAFGGPDPFGKPEKVETVDSVSADVPVPAQAVAPEIAPAWRESREEPAALANTKDEELKSGTKKDTPEKDLVREAAMAAAASADGSASPDLSSIVDNMLAELKPKLMAELAKKLDQKK